MEDAFDEDESCKATSLEVIVDVLHFLLGLENLE